MAGNKVREFSGSNFKTEVLQSSKPVVVDFWAAWCGPCRMIAPVVEELASEYEGRAIVGKLNVDEHRQVAIDYGVMSIPTLLVFKDGQVVDRIVGYRPKKELGEIIERHLDG